MEGEMEESFEVRVKRLFGSQLFESVPRSSFPASSWSVADGEVERREWNRERGAGPDRSDDPCSSAFAEGGCFTKKRRARRGLKEGFDPEAEELDDDVDEEGPSAEEEEEGKDGGDDRNREEEEMRSFVGLDPTLDNEDEEDEYDRAALCKDGTDERLYMRDVKNHGPHLNYHSVFADAEDEQYVGSHHFYKDPRADHFAAGMRLEEDKKAAENISVSVPNAENPATICSLKVTEEDIKLKPILKRKEAQNDSKPKKRVRFDCKADNDEVLKEAHEYFPAASDSNSVMLEESTGIPDYMRNPSKYTHYTFDTYEDDDLANKNAFEDFKRLYGKSNHEELQQNVILELPKSITFNPRKKSIDAMPVDDSGDDQESGITKDFLKTDLWMSRTTGVAAGESYEAGVCKMDEDDLEITISGERTEPLTKGRKYRSRAISDD